MSGVGQLVSSGPMILAMPVAAAAGAVTFLSPCCLPLVPGYLSFVTGMAGAGGSPPASATLGDAPGPAPPGGSGVAVAALPLAATAAAPPRGRVVAGTALFVLGFSVVFVAYGAALGGLGPGDGLGDHLAGLRRAESGWRGRCLRGAKADNNGLG